MAHDELFHAFLPLVGPLQARSRALKELFLLGYLGSQVQEFFLHQLSLRRRDRLRQHSLG